MPITYATEPGLTAEEFRAILVASTLAERRPADDLARLDRMLRAADIIVTARDGARLVGVARAITDFSYCCYLSDLAVDAAYQRQGRRGSDARADRRARRHRLLPQDRHGAGRKRLAHSAHEITNALAHGAANSIATLTSSGRRTKASCQRSSGTRRVIRPASQD
jgi:hypothetical protein